MTYAALVIGSRVLRGLAPMVAAEKCGIHYKRWVSYERGEQTPTRAGLRRIENALDVSFGSITNPPRRALIQRRVSVKVVTAPLDRDMLVRIRSGHLASWLSARDARVPEGGGTFSTRLYQDYVVWCELQGKTPWRRRSWGVAMGGLFSRCPSARGQYHRVVLRGMPPDFLPARVVRSKGPRMNKSMGQPVWMRGWIV